MTKKIQPWGWGLLLAIGLGYALIGYWLGFNADDYNWGGRFLAYWRDGALNYDGRYLGNSLATTAVVTPVLCATLYGATMAAIFGVVSKLLGRYDLAALVLVTITLVPAPVFAQTLGWKSGFFNYVTSILGPLVLLVVAERELFGEPFKHRGWVGFGLGLAMLLGSFFSEPVTLLLLVSTLSLVVVSWVRKRPVGILIDGASQAILGAILMFINPGYRSQLAVGAGTDRTLSLTSMREMVTVITNSVSQAWLVFGLMALALLWWAVQDHRLPVILTLALGLIVFAYMCLGAVLVPPVSPTLALWHKRLWYLVSAVSLVLFFWYLRTHQGREFWLPLYCLLAAVALLAPFLVLQPFGPRSEYGVYVLLALLTGFILQATTRPARLMTTGLGLTLVLTLGYTLRLSHIVGQPKRLNDVLLAQQAQKDFKINGHKRVYYVRYRADDWRWSWSPRAQTQDGPLMTYYNIPQKLPASLVPATELNPAERLTPVQRYQLLERYDQQPNHD